MRIIILAGDGRNDSAVFRIQRKIQINGQKAADLLMVIVENKDKGFAAFVYFKIS